MKATMAQVDRVNAEDSGGFSTPRMIAAAGSPSLKSVELKPDVVPFAVDVLFVGNSTRTLAKLASQLKGLDLTSRDTLAVDDLFKLGGRQLPQLILVDDEAAGIDALGFVGRVASSPRLRDVPIILLSPSAEISHKVNAFSAGVVDYIGMPANIEELVVRVLTHLRLRRAQLESDQHSRRLEAFVLEQVSEITDSQMATIIALAKLAESRDDQTGGHLERVQQYCRLLAMKLSEQMRFGIIDQTFIDNIEYASALHDIGKVAISDLILLKPAELTDEEFELMKTHTMLGAQTLEAVNAEYPSNDFIEMGIKIARWHHERWDGSGYPDGLVGENIPLPARIMAVADVYDALMSQRSYKRSFTHLESRDVIVAQRGKQFDPDVIDAFLSVEGEFSHVPQT
jgi:putative two-component system response regulator